MTRLLLIRHGESVWNKDERLQGQMDIPLSDLGRRQALAVGVALAGERLDAAYASDLVRAWETAQTCLRGRQVEIVAEPRFRERHFGNWQGLTRQQVEAVRRAASPGQASEHLPGEPLGAEPWTQVQERVAVALQEIIARHPDQAVLVVAHGGPIRVALTTLLNLPLETRRHLRTDNACLCEFEVGPEGTYLVRWNDTHHLRIAD